MGKFTRIPKNTFDVLQMDAGILLNKFDPTLQTEILDDDMITATTGGIHIVVEPTYSDLGEDVDNCPVNMKELKHLDGWNVTIETSAYGTSAENIRMALGAADIDGSNTKIVPRRALSQEDFCDIWWVGDKANGGFVAAHLMNALSTGGLDLQTTKNGKGQTSLTFTGHVSIDDQDTMPIEFYSVDGDETESPEINLNKRVATVKEGEAVTIVAKTVPADAVVTWSSDDDEVATVSGGVVTAVAEGSVIITAGITVEGIEYTDTCTIIVTATA